MLYPLGNLSFSDIETTGLLEQMALQEHPRLHNLGYIDQATGKEVCIEWTDRKAIQAFLDTGPTMVMHNGYCFDKEALTFLGFDTSKIRIIDTLWTSWYLFPKRPKHGLESYGEEAGIPKPVIEDWENQTQEEYNERVMEDCKIQRYVWNLHYSMLLKIYGSEQEVCRFLDYLMSKARQQVIQQRTRWKLDIEKAKEFKALVEPMIGEQEERLRQAMPEVIKYKIKSRPAKTHKQDGQMSKAGLEWKTLCDANGVDWKDPNVHFKFVDKKEPANPGSHVQVKDWLFSLGWEPETFKFVRNKETGETRQIPQITVKDEDDNPDICPSLHKLAEANPGKGVEALIGLGVYRNRASIVNGWLRNVSPDGFLTARCGGLTNTLRLKHRGLVNIPSDRVFGGAELRGMLSAESPDHEQLGSDLSSLEDRCKHNYQWVYDPEYVKKQLAPDYDAHLAIGVIGGFITEKQSQDHKDKIAKVKERPMFKTTNYACQYGAGVATIQRGAKCDWATAERLHKAYWDLNWSIKEVAKNTKVKTIDGQMWQWNPVSKFWYSLRNDKDRFSTLCQGTGSYVFDVWVNAVIDICNERWGVDPKLCGQFHDELILQVRKGNRELWKELVGVEAIGRANEILKMNRDVACDVQFGDRYSEIH